jgi:uncharacterized protein with PQ loop repeat
MFKQLLGTAATVYGVLGALKTLLQARQMLARRSSREVSARFLASYTGGYAIWLTYGLSTGSLPLIVVDTVGLLCGGVTLAVALSLRGGSPDVTGHGWASQWRRRAAVSSAARSSGKNRRAPSISTTSLAPGMVSRSQ